MLAIMADSMAEVGYELTPVRILIADGSSSTRMGFAFFIFGIAGLTGNPIVGALIGYDPAQYHWWKGIVFSGVGFSSCCLRIGS